MALKKNLDQLVLDQLISRIINGDWEQGQILEVDELAGYYEVSRTPVLQALKRMQAEGMLTVSRGGKFFLPTYNDKQVTDICRTRLVLELEALDEIGSMKGSLAANLDSFKALAQACRENTEAGNVVPSRRLDMDLHRAIIAASGNECLISLYPKVQGQFMIANYLLVFHSRQQQMAASDEHGMIIQCLSNEDIEGAKKAMADHINSARERIISRMPQSKKN